MKQCQKCHQQRSKNNFHRDSKSKDGLFAYCKKCSWEITKNWRLKNKEKVNQNRKIYYQKHKKQLFLKRKERDAKNSEIGNLRRKWNRTYRLKKYGITLNDYQKMLISQSTKCAICGIFITDDTAKIDHCHKTGKIRGLLCNRCNVSLGHLEKSFKDNGLLDKAIAYLGNLKKQEIENLR